MSNVPAPSEDDFKKLVDAYIEWFPELFDRLGIKIPKGTLQRVSPRKKEKLAIGLKESFGKLSEIEKLGSAESDPQKELLRLDRLGELTASLAGAPKHTYIAEFYVNYFHEAVDPWVHLAYFRRSRYREERDAIRKTVMKLHQENKVGKAIQFLDEFGNGSDGILLAQPMMANFGKHIRYLSKRKTTFEKNDLDRLFEIYRHLSGAYEKLIRLVVGLLMILEGRDVSYEMVRRRPLASNSDYVRRRIPDLVSGFDIIIRNALAHSSTMIHFSNSTIDFVDEHNHKTLSFRQFYESWRLFSSLVVAIWLIRGHFELKSWQDRLAYYRRVKKLAAKS